MQNFVQGLAEASEFWALVGLVVLGGMNQLGWVDPRMFDTFWPVLLGYAGLRVTSKTGKNAVANLRAKRGTNQAHGGREVEK